LRSPSFATDAPPTSAYPMTIDGKAFFDEAEPKDGFRRMGTMVGLLPIWAYFVHF